MSIEVSNESGLDVSEEELISVARFVIRKMNVNPGAELSMVLLDLAADGLSAPSCTASQVPRK